MWILFIFYKNITFQQPLVAAKIKTVGLIVASKSENITYSIQNTCTCNHHWLLHVHCNTKTNQTFAIHITDSHTHNTG